VFKIEVLILSY